MCAIGSIRVYPDLGVVGVNRECAKCAHTTTPGGEQCYTMTRRLKELVTDAGKPFVPEFVIPALDTIAGECKRYQEAQN